ncbi:MAG: ABC transporter ATP-binding protein [Alphaproteobacteria bacterium]|nr:MAG: ABC transporter ATP-binding protein [Alphaproteobacteria bacterium]
MSENSGKDKKVPSIISALRKINALVSWDDKLKIIYMGCFALIVSLLEVATAATVVLFGQILNTPEVGQQYLEKLGITWELSTDDILVAAAMLCGVVYLFKNIVASFEVFFQNFNIQKMNYHFKNALLERYAYADYADYLTRNSSYNSRVVGGDAEQVFSGAMLAMAIILSETIIFSFLVGLIIYINPSLALVIFVIGLLISMVIAKFLLPLFYWWGKQSQEAAVMSWQNLLQFFHAFKEIIILGKREAFVGYYKEYSLKQARLGAIQTSTKALPRLVIEVLFIGLFVTAICFLAYSDQPLSSMVGTLGGYLYAGFRLMPGLNRIITQLNIFKTVIPSIERVYDEYMTVATPENYVDIPEFHFDTDIEIKNVTCHYKNVEQHALKDISFTIKKGESIGIVGETGSGKSTLTDVILGLLRPQSGTVLVDGQFSVSSKQWHGLIGYVPQSLYLTDSTIESNIAFGERADTVNHEKLQKAIDAAQLAPLLNKLPEGLQTLVGERGVRLSGGERQRVAIARALYREPDVLIFDEATSALDNDTEARLMATIEKISENRTVIMVAHRLSTLEKCDRIIELKDGCLHAISSSVQQKDV